MSGVRVAEAQSVVSMVLTFSEDGKVTGSSPDNGCKVLGVWSPGSTPRLFSWMYLSIAVTTPSSISGTLGKPLSDVPERMASVVAGREYVALPWACRFGGSMWGRR